MLDIDTLAAQAETLAKQLKISKYDISGSAIDSTSVQIDQGKPKQVKASQRSSVTVRVWNDAGTIGIASTSDIDMEGMELALKTAHEASNFGNKENVPDFSPEAKTPVVDLKHPKVAPLPVNALIEKLAEAEQELLGAHSAIDSLPYNGISQTESEGFYVNSDGARRVDGGTSAVTYLYTKAQEEGRRPRSAGAYRVGYGVEELDLKGCIAETAEKTISHLGYDKIETGKYTVVFSPEAILSLIGAFSNMFNAQNILDNMSLSDKDSIGKELATPKLSVYDDELHEANIGASTFDAEGTPTRRVALIEKGVLTGFLHSAGTAKRLNAKPTGHANLGAKVTVSPNFFHIAGGEGGDMSLETAENVVYVDELSALHAGVQSLQGSFSLPFDGWLVNKGKKVSVESATVAGDIRELLKNIAQVDVEEKQTPSGVAPHVWVEGLSITGE